MNPRAFAITKEHIAIDCVSDATAGAMVPQVYELPKAKGGQDLAAAEAHRKVAQVSLGKHAILYRLGNDASERGEAISELSFMLRASFTRDGKTRKVPFNEAICKCIAAVALHELAFDQCPPCSGRGKVRDHDNEDLEGRQPMKSCPNCSGVGRLRFNEDARIKRLSEEWILAFPEQPLDDGSAAGLIAKSLRKFERLRALLNAVDYAKALLLSAERVATEETIRMLERWA